jgi:hypothetical protein
MSTFATLVASLLWTSSFTVAMFPPGRSPQSDLFEFEHPNQLANPLLQRFEIWVSRQY